MRRPTRTLRVQHAIARFEAVVPDLLDHQVTVRLEGPRPGLVLRPARGRPRGRVDLAYSVHGELRVAASPAGAAPRVQQAAAQLADAVGAALRASAEFFATPSSHPLPPITVSPRPPAEPLKAPSDHTGPGAGLPVDRKQALAERVLADAQLDDPALLGLDVSVSVGERLLCRSGRGDLRPRTDVVLDAEGQLLLLGLPARATPDQERAMVKLTLALQHALRRPSPARRQRAEG